MPLLFGLFMIAGPVEAQIQRPAGTVYGKIGTGISEYTGDYSPSPVPYAFGHFGHESGFPYMVRGEIGYKILPQVAVGAGFQTGNYPFSGQSGTLGTNRSVLQILARYTLGADRWRIAPFVDVGRALAFGGNQRGHGASVGMGLDVFLSPHFSLILESRSNVLWPGDAVDNRGLKFRGIDQLSQLVGLGLEVNLQTASVAPEIQSVDVDPASDGTIGFTAQVNENVSRPVEYEWAFAEGATTTGQSVTHTFGHSGPHEVLVTASNAAGKTTRSVYVVASPSTQPTTIAGVNATPNPASVGEHVQFTSQIEGPSPSSFQWRFGDGQRSSAETPSHRYTEPGTYTVELTASAQGKEAHHTVQLSIEPARNSVAGRITRSDSNTTVPNAQVRATPLDVDSTLGTDKTNRGGEFSIPGLPSELVALRTQKPGFRPHRDTVNLSDTNTAQLDIVLSPRRGNLVDNTRTQNRSDYTLVLGRFRDSSRAGQLARLGQASGRDLTVLQPDTPGHPNYEVLAKEHSSRSAIEHRGRIYSAIIQASSTELYTIQHGVFANRQNAENLVQTLHEQGHASYVQSINRDGRALTRVRTGLYLQRETAERHSSRLEDDAPAAVVTSADL